MNIRLGTDSFNITVTTPMTGCIEKYGPRFDTLGAVTGISMEGVEFCAMEGLIDEFNIQDPFPPPGYAEAQPGGSFLKIGVGELVRPDNRHYQFCGSYPVNNMPPVEVSSDDGAVEMSQTCVSENTGLGYEYRKKVMLDPANSAVEIEYFLKNIGRRTFHAEQYNHNWFNIGGGAIDESYILEHPLQLGDHLSDWFKLDERTISISSRIVKPSYYPSDASVPAESNRIRLLHSGTGMSVTARGNFTASRFALYADSTALCPEIFTRISLASGCSETWKRVYEFKIPEPCMESEASK